MASSTRHFRAYSSKEDYKKNKELEEARKAGTEAPQVDEEGNDIDPHIPDYVKRTPWYLGIDVPSLRHQRISTFDKKKVTSLDTHYIRGELETPNKVITKYRKGACENCGAMTHDKRSCTERPRKIGAKYNCKRIKNDEIIDKNNFEMDFEAKRDRFNGYDPERYIEVIENYQKLENARRAQVVLEEEQNLQKMDQEKNENLDSNNENGNKSQSILSQVNFDEYKQAQEHDDVGQFAKIDGKTHNSIRNLRIREDTAKYLLDLSENAPYYDSKTHSQRAPLKNVNETIIDNPHILGDNYFKHTGDAIGFNSINKFSYSNYDDNTLHPQANPSETALLYKKYKQEQEKKIKEKQQKVLEQYGGHEHLELPHPDLLFGTQSEDYVEYMPEGNIKTNNVKKIHIPKSRYIEDEFPGNHTSIYGSYWVDGKWGYKCCNQTEKTSNCTKTETE